MCILLICVHPWLGVGWGSIQIHIPTQSFFKVHIKAYFCQGAVPDFEFLLYFFFFGLFVYSCLKFDDSVTRQNYFAAV